MNPDYYFEREQQVKFVVNDIDGHSVDFIGQTETTIAHIIGAPR